jgi:uncharacterized protein YukE
MAGAGFEAKLDAIDAGAAAQEKRRTAAQQVRNTVEAATGQGNLYGVVGELTGTARSYQDWQQTQTQSLGDLVRLLGDLAAGLRRTAETYRVVDEECTKRTDDLLRGVGGGLSPDSILEMKPIVGTPYPGWSPDDLSGEIRPIIGTPPPDGGVAR